MTALGWRKRGYGVKPMNTSQTKVRSTDEALSVKQPCCVEDTLKLALEALESSRIFVTSREKIKHPEGTDWYDERIAAIKEALAQQNPQGVSNEQVERALKKMTAHRAIYFMERFKHEEKLLGPNEQAALDFVIAMLESHPPVPTAQTDRK